MSGETRARPLALVIPCVLAATSCGGPLHEVGSDTVERPPIAAASPPEAFGYQVRVETADTRYTGELVGCDGGDLYLFLNGVRPSWVMIPWIDVRLAEVRTPHASVVIGFAVWDALASVSTLTHGVFLLGSVPGWALVGAPSTVAAEAATRISTESCPGLQPYARFPQGVPRVMMAHFGMPYELGPGPAPARPVLTPPPGPGDRAPATGPADVVPPPRESLPPSTAWPVPSP